MKYVLTNPYEESDSRAPHGARGLKFNLLEREVKREASRPARGAWIEILRELAAREVVDVAPRTGRVD